MESKGICEEDLQKIRDIPLDEVFSKLGMEVVRNRVRCYRPENHAHGDRDRSISISRQNKWKCWVCDDGGTKDAIDLVMDVQGMTFREACIWIASNWGISLKEVSKEDSFRIGRKQIKTNYKPREIQPIRFEDLSYLEDECCKIYQDFFDLCLPPDEKLKSWWKGRGFTPDHLYKCDLRLVEGSVWRSMLKKHSLSTLIKCGLYKPKNCEIEHILVEGSSPNLEDYVPAFRGGYNVVFPFFNGSKESLQSGERKIVGFKVRNIGNIVKPDGKKLPKYLMPTGWSVHIYCFDDLWRWRESETRPEAIYLTESETSCIAMQELFKLYGKEGYCVALPSASQNLDSVLVRELIEFVAKTDRSTKLVVVADNDKVTEGRSENDTPGMKFYHTIGQAAYNAGIETHLYQPHKKFGLKDANDYLLKVLKNTSMKYSKTDTSASNERVIKTNKVSPKKG